MTRSKLIGLAAVLTCSAWGSQAIAQAVPIPMGDTELQGERGGFLTANGIRLDFGAIVRTFVEGQLALETRLTWTTEGAVTEQTTGNAIAGAVSLADGAATAAAGGLNLSGLADGSSGLVFADASGATALVHNLMNGHIENLVFNTGNNRDIRQEVHVNLALPDLPAMQQGYGMDRLGSQLSQDINLGLLQSLGR